MVCEARKISCSSLTLPDSLSNRTISSSRSCNCSSASVRNSFISCGVIPSANSTEVLLFEFKRVTLYFRIIRILTAGPEQLFGYRKQL